MEPITLYTVGDIARALGVTASVMHNWVTRKDESWVVPFAVTSTSNKLGRSMINLWTEAQVFEIEDKYLELKEKKEREKAEREELKKNPEAWRAHKREYFRQHYRDNPEMYAKYRDKARQERREEIKSKLPTTEELEAITQKNIEASKKKEREWERDRKRRERNQIKKTSHAELKELDLTETEIEDKEREDRALRFLLERGLV